MFQPIKGVQLKNSSNMINKMSHQM